MNRTGDDFIEITRGHACALVSQTHRDAVADALFDGEGCLPLDVAGRGVIMRFPLDADRAGVLRVCRRGGLLRHLLKEGYLLRNRPLSEFRVHRETLARGIPAPTLLGVRWERRGGLYYGALATELIHGEDLDAWLRANRDNTERVQAIVHRCGTVIRQMHDAGAYHADLQLKNIFVADSHLFLLDFDRARFCDAVSPLARAKNLLRLRRSFEKRGHPCDLWRLLLDGYGDVTLPRWLDTAYRVRARISDMIQGRRTLQV